VKKIMTQENRTPNCNMHELLVTYLYGEASPEEGQRFATHLLDCLSCRQELSAFESVRESLQQWQFDEVPEVRLVATNAGRKSALALLKELFTIMPLWAKSLGAVAMAMLVLALLGTDVKIGKDGFSYRADILRKGEPSVAQTSGAPGNPLISKEQLEQIRADLMREVSAEIAQSEQTQKDEVRAQLVSFQSQLKDMRSADLVKIAAQVQQHKLKIQTIEHDIDRREGLGLTDILLGEATRPNDRSRTGGE
jgi:hypothetical protein